MNQIFLKCQIKIFDKFIFYFASFGARCEVGQTTCVSFPSLKLNILWWLYYSIVNFVVLICFLIFFIYTASEDKLTLKIFLNFFIFLSFVYCGIVDSQFLSEDNEFYSYVDGKRKKLLNQKYKFRNFRFFYFSKSYYKIFEQWAHKIFYFNRNKWKVVLLSLLSGKIIAFLKIHGFCKVTKLDFF